MLRASVGRDGDEQFLEFDFEPLSTRGGIGQESRERFPQVLINRNDFAVNHALQTGVSKPLRGVGNVLGGTLSPANGRRRGHDKFEVRAGCIVVLLNLRGEASDEPIDASDELICRFFGTRKAERRIVAQLRELFGQLQLGSSHNFHGDGADGFFELRGRLRIHGMSEEIGQLREDARNDTRVGTPCEPPLRLQGCDMRREELFDRSAGRAPRRIHKRGNEGVGIQPHSRPRLGDPGGNDFPRPFHVCGNPIDEYDSGESHGRPIDDLAPRPMVFCRRDRTNGWRTIGRRRGSMRFRNLPHR